MWQQGGEALDEEDSRRDQKDRAGAKRQPEGQTHDRSE
jgi:hypothetical protein